MWIVYPLTPSLKFPPAPQTMPSHSKRMVVKNYKGIKGNCVIRCGHECERTSGYVCVCVCLCTCSIMSNYFATLWTVTCQAPLSMGFPKQAYWSGLPFPLPGDLPHAGIKPTSPALSGGFFAFPISFFTLLVNHTRGPRWVQTSPCYQSPTAPRLHSPH